jgi:hypothetical protein
MSRTHLRNDVASRIVGAATGYRRGIVLQVIGAGSAWYGPERSALENTDQSGTPSSGNFINAASGQVIFQEHTGDMWARGSDMGVEVEVNTFRVGDTVQGPQAPGVLRSLWDGLFAKGSQ